MKYNIIKILLGVILINTIVIIILLLFIAQKQAL